METATSLYCRTLTEKLRRKFTHDNVQVNTTLERIEVYFMRDSQGKDWVPYGGGPLYGESARESAAWLAAHITEFRSLLPKIVRDWPIVCGCLETRTYPGVFTVR